MKDLEFNIFDTRLPKIKPMKGRILIAEPFLQGPYFNRSIVFLTEHGEDGAVGFVLNKSSDVYPDEVIEDLFNFKGEMYIGGPVSSNTLHYIHTLGDKVPGAIKVTEHLYWGGDFETIKKLINSGVADYHSVKFFAGYSGWSAGQLEDEIKENSWIVSTLDDKMIMEGDVDNFWRNAIEKLGEAFRLWANFPENPSDN